MARRGQIVILPMDLFRGNNTPGGQRRSLVYGHIHAHSSGSAEGCWASIHTLALESGYSESTIKRTVRELVAMGWVERRSRPGHTSVLWALAEQRPPRTQVTVDPPPRSPVTPPPGQGRPTPQVRGDLQTRTQEPQPKNQNPGTISFLTPTVAAALDGAEPPSEALPWTVATAGRLQLLRRHPWPEGDFRRPACPWSLEELRQLWQAAEGWLSAEQDLQHRRRSSLLPQQQWQEELAWARSLALDPDRRWRALAPPPPLTAGPTDDELWGVPVAAVLPMAVAELPRSLQGIADQIQLWWEAKRGQRSLAGFQAAISHLEAAVTPERLEQVRQFLAHAAMAGYPALSFESWSRGREP